ncbi:CCHC-type domain-containing protein [Caenorhabditis elegans]|uniref:CCHC-type domain-containing protein n=1 Tax=Caenorhabditis elegans TaxID=6239 RepID=P91176_CAEEL|nr:CCHC-type domain-containing protein [Caenorhabditis elegans]CCD67769.1 CCHC-type domain-containing protein [Caenorhabditis elegans]|eukprot:NP_491251.1 Uncharacterized protein CELE_C50F2.2 [Caenorhabditis elegans]
MEDVNDLYTMALGEFYAPAPSTSSIKKPAKVPEDQPSTSSAPPTTALFRQLLIGSRSQIERLKKENEELKTKLKHATSSGGVVICPNCTHHFKDRQCPMRPRAMKKMRARNCVELEFGNLEDLEMWLYLNQLETNNDGMPTVMNVKKATNCPEKSLKESGSLLPELVEKKREEKRQQEDQKAVVLEKRKPVTQKVQDHLKRRSKSPIGRGKDQSDKDIISNKKRKLNRQSKEEIDERSKIAKKAPISQRVQFPRMPAPQAPDAVASKVREQKPVDITPHPRPSASRNSESQKPVASKIQEKKTEVRTKSSPTNPIVNSKQPSQKKPADLTPHPKRPPITPETLPSRNSEIQKPAASKIQEKKTEVIARSQKSEASTKIAQKPSPTNPTVNFKQPSQKPADLTPKPITLASKSPITRSSEVSTEPSTKPKRAPIVWDDKPKDSTAKELPKELPKAKSHFEFKVKPIEKKDASPPKTTSTSSASPPNPDPAMKQKYKFVPTSKKQKLTETKNKDQKSTINESPVECQNSGQNEASNPTKLKDQELNKHVVPKNPEAIETPDERQESVQKSNEASATSSTKPSDPVETPSDEVDPQETQWKVYSVKQSRPVLDHIYKFALARQSLKRHWNDKMIVLNGDVPQEKVEESKPLSIAESLKRIGVSVEGIAVLQKQLKASAPEPPVLSTTVDDEDALGEFFPDLAKRKTSEIRPVSAESLWSVTDREEEELKILVREDSVVPPSGDCLMDVEAYEITEDLESQTYEASQSDWKEFCLEDVDDDVDETLRERKLSEMEKSAENLDENMDWIENLEELGNDDEQEEEEEEDQEQEQEQVAPSRSISVPLEMKNDFVLSDEDDPVSPVTSTPRKEDFNDDLSGCLEEDEEDTENLLPQAKDDSFIDELDWNYGTDYEEEEVEEAEVVVEEKDNSGSDHDATLEDGEISENDDGEDEKKEEEPKKPIRERTKFMITEDQLGPKTDEEEDEPPEIHRAPPRKRKINYNRQKGSEDNRHRNYRKRDTRPATYLSLLKRRNS